jgi:hypothetical protein
MYSRLNVLVNDINALGVKDITDLNINRKILQSLRKHDYDLVKAIIYEKKLEDLKPSHMLSKIMAHELQLMPKSKKAPQEKPQEPSSPTTSHALSSQQQKMLSRMATHGSSSEDDGDDGDDGDSSSDEEVESMVAEYVNKIFKYVKKVNMYGYTVHLREGRHHQHIKFTKIEHKPKKKVVKERRLLTPKFGKESDLWVQLGEESVRWKEGFFRCIRQKNPRSAICFRSAKELLS